MRTGSIFKTCALIAAMALTGSTIAAPPPPPSFIDDIAKQLVPTPTKERFDLYSAALADDLTVSIDGKQVAANKAAWIAIERRRLGKVDRTVLGFVEGYDSILVFDRFDDRSDVPAAPDAIYDARYKIRASQYEMGADHLVHAIRIVQADGLFRTSPMQ